jgi:hypothetical protein
MPAGTSILGDQQVFADQDRSNRYVQVNVGDRGERPSSRVGFYYLVLTTADSFRDSSVIKTGLVYSPGVLVKIPQIPRTDNHVLGLWVAWNEAGLSYFWQFRS